MLYGRQVWGGGNSLMVGEKKIADRIGAKEGRMRHYRGILIGLGIAGLGLLGVTPGLVSPELAGFITILGFSLGAVYECLYGDDARPPMPRY